MTTGALRALATEFEQFVREPPDAPIPADLGELAAFAGVRKVRSRRTCATLALKAAVAALGAALRNVLQKNPKVGRRDLAEVRRFTLLV